VIFVAIFKNKKMPRKNIITGWRLLMDKHKYDGTPLPHNNLNGFKGDTNNNFQMFPILSPW